jgi:histidine triad (HIT) family protein
MSECIFCQIVKGERSAEVIDRDNTLVVFKDINPKAPVHLLLVPIKHIRSVNDLTDDDRVIVADLIYKARDVARRMEIAESGYRLTFNVERGGGQIIFHLHLHLIGGW